MLKSSISKPASPSYYFWRGKTSVDKKVDTSFCTSAKIESLVQYFFQCEQSISYGQSHPFNFKRTSFICIVFIERESQYLNHKYYRKMKLRQSSFGLGLNCPNMLALTLLPLKTFLIPERKQTRNLLIGIETLWPYQRIRISDKLLKNFRNWNLSSESPSFHSQTKVTKILFWIRLLEESAPVNSISISGMPTVQLNVKRRWPPMERQFCTSVLVSYAVFYVSFSLPRDILYFPEELSLKLPTNYFFKRQKRV